MTGTSEKLDSWKQIAGYLDRDVKTVQRWEHHEGLPIHRHPHAGRSSVFAWKAEIDTWLQDRQQDPLFIARSGWHPPADRVLCLVLVVLVAITLAVHILRTS